MPGFGLVVLAAGSASRMGSAKQLLEYRGRPLVRHAVETALAADLGPVVVVVGARAREVGAALAGLPVEVIENPIWQRGMGTSIHAGVEALQHRDPEGLVLMVGDQPLVTASMLCRLVAASQFDNSPIVASRYAGTLGVPAYFARSVRDELLKLGPSEGCKRLLTSRPERVISVGCPEAAFDIDTPADYWRLKLETSDPERFA